MTERPTPDYVICHFCGLEWSPDEADEFDLTPEGEPYPYMVPVCPEHAEVGCR